MNKKIALGADHRGFKLKEAIKKFLAGQGIDFYDFGAHSEEPVDYPEIAEKVALSISRNKCSRGILICGSGIGMCITANKIKNIRAALCYNVKTALLSRKHNDANILVMSGSISSGLAQKIVKVWLKTEFEGGRHQRRINQIKSLEKKVFKDKYL